MKLEQLKISSDDHGWLAEEQLRLKRATGDKPTQAELFHLMREAYEANAGGRAAVVWEHISKIIASGDEKILVEAARLMKGLALRVKPQEPPARGTIAKGGRVA